MPHSNTSEDFYNSTITTLDEQGTSLSSFACSFQRLETYPNLAVQHDRATGPWGPQTNYRCKPIDMKRHQYINTCQTCQTSKKTTVSKATDTLLGEIQWSWLDSRCQRGCVKMRSQKYIRWLASGIIEKKILAQRGLQAPQHTNKWHGFAAQGTTWCKLLLGYEQFSQLYSIHWSLTL